jgi:hypothetical protein
MAANKAKKSSKHLKRGKKLGAVKSLKKPAAPAQEFLTVKMNDTLISSYNS